MLRIFLILALISVCNSESLPVDGIQRTSAELDPVVLEHEQLAFVERSIVEVFQRGTFPEIFGARTDFLSSCGCPYTTYPVYWGSKIGLMCKLDAQLFKEQCGERCVSPRGQDILLVCPEGWKNDCQQGCVPPVFKSVQERSNFLENMVDEIIRFGFDYVVIDPTYTHNCGCDDTVRNIRYGTNVGFECVVNDKRTPSEDCGAYRGCMDENENGLLIFCPAGHTPTCSGCQKLLDRSAPKSERYEYMVAVMTGYLRETKDALDLQPRPSQVIDCGCTSAFKPIEGYGNRIGFSCVVNDPSTVNAEGCGPNILCQDENDETVLHLCPTAFTPNCEDGCGYSWDTKAEL